MGKRGSTSRCCLSECAQAGHVATLQHALVPFFANRAHPLSYSFCDLTGMDDIVVLAVKCDVAVWSVFEFFRIFDILWHGLSVGEIRVKFLEVEMYLCDLPLYSP